MPELTLEIALDVPFTFVRRPVPMPCDVRPVWRMHVLVLLLNQCRGAKAGFEQIHVLNWAIRSPETRTAFLQFIHGKRAPNDIIVRYDPSLNRAVQFAFAEGLVVHHETEPSLIEDKDEKRGRAYRVILTDRGHKLVAEIKAMDDCFTTEKQFLKEIGAKISQKQVKSLFTWN
ncbi:MAG: hypothetical protein KDA86_16030 [Planctomycetaceae bacterium]|nr:hypothetical protein [Planctomycetaceae bacterium]